jgi:quinoprotein glucose dehydrogenase
MTSRTLRPFAACALVLALSAVFVNRGGLRSLAGAALEAQGRQGGAGAGGPAPATTPPPPDVEWKTYGADLASSRYSPLDQINADNFSSLQVAWRFKTDSLGPRAETNLQATPLMVGGVVYSVAGTRRSVVALDAATGELLWVHREDEGPRGQAAPRQLSGRGLAYWSDSKTERILFVTPGYRLKALDAKTGHLVGTFGKGGVVDLKLDNDQAIDLVTGDIGLHAAPVVTRDTIIVGAALREGSSPRSRTNIKGFVRAFDVRTGRRIWTFHTIPMRTEFGADTWENGSAEYTGNNGVWAQMSVDEELGLVYLPVEMPTGDYYGGHRPGNNLFSESLVAVDVKTGARKWHYQFIKHGIWDWDLPCAPILADVTIDGKPRKIVAQPSKQAWLYVLDRVTGQPIWPFEERPVEQSTVPGEKTSPTQTFVVKPPPFDRQGVSIDDLIDFTPELRAEAVKFVARYRIGPIFTPIVVSRWEGPFATLMLPNATGGANWPGGSYDPETKRLYIYSKTDPSSLGLVPGEQSQSDMAWVFGRARNPEATGTGQTAPVQLRIQGLPLIKPPYGRITAFDLSKGDIAWQVAHGETPDEIRNHPMLKGVNIPRTGRPGFIGTLVTKTLVIAGEPGMFTTPNGQRGAMLRAYDKMTGREVGSVYLPAPQTGSPMTYRRDGRQYLIVAIGSAQYGAEFIAFRLPQPQAGRAGAAG